MERFATAAADQLDSQLTSGCAVGVMSGNTVKSVVEALRPTTKKLQSVVALVGGIGAGSMARRGTPSMLLGRRMHRQTGGLSPPRQIRLLERYGFRFVGTWSFDAASKVISRLAALNWKLPYGFNPATYVPS